jgi:hypothetical protein
MVYVLGVAGLLGVVFQQVALQTARLAPAVALVAAVAISLSEERQRRSGPSVRERPADEGDGDAGRARDDKRLDNAAA